MWISQNLGVRYASARILWVLFIASGLLWHVPWAMGHGLPMKAMKFLEFHYPHGRASKRTREIPHDWAEWEGFGYYGEHQWFLNVIDKLSTNNYCESHVLDQAVNQLCITGQVRRDDRKSQAPHKSKTQQDRATVLQPVFCVIMGSRKQDMREHHRTESSSMSAASSSYNLTPKSLIDHIVNTVNRGHWPMDRRRL